MATAKTDPSVAPDGDQDNDVPAGQEGDPTPAGEQGKKDPPEGQAPEGEQEPEKRSLAELLKDPQLAAQHGKLVAQAKRQAESDAKKRLQEEAAETAKRANMAEVDRLKAELADKDKDRARLERELREVQVDRDINRILVEGGVRLQEGALDVLRDKVLAATKDEDDPDYSVAVTGVLEKFSWLRQGSKPAGEERIEPDGKGSPAQPRRPGGKPATVAPAKPEPQKTVDVMKMTPQEYAKHRRERGIT